MIRLAVRCSPASAERVLAELVDLVPGGVEEERGPGWVEYAIYGPPGELPALPELEAAAGEGLVEVATTEIPDDWADRWRDFHEPVDVGGRLVVRPSWEQAGQAGEGGSGPLEVVIDPGQAFGTGAHATTRMCLELLLDLAEGPDRGSLADLGSGSGVLAIAAARLGWDPVRAYDHEPAAVEAARANGALNGVRIEVERLDLRRNPPPLADAWVANLTGPMLVEVASGLSRVGDARDARPRLIVVGGLLRSEAGRVEAAFGAAGLAPARRLESGEWMALLLRR